MTDCAIPTRSPSTRASVATARPVPHAAGGADERRLMDCRVTVTAYPEARYRQWKRNPELRGSEIVSRKGAEGPGVNESMVRSAVDAAYQDARHAISIIVDSYTGLKLLTRRISASSEAT